MLGLMEIMTKASDARGSGGWDLSWFLLLEK
jgi:hypothetical protein